MKRGFELHSDDLEEVRINQSGRWRRWFFGNPDPPVLTVRHSSIGKFTFVLRNKKDVVFALCELERLLGDRFDIAFDINDYKKMLTKYKKMRDS